MEANLPKVENIYEISKKKCEQSYFGHTQRSNKSGFKEHICHSINRRIEKSSVAQHTLKYKNRVDTQNLPLIKVYATKGN